MSHARRWKEYEFLRNTRNGIPVKQTKHSHFSPRQKLQLFKDLCDPVNIKKYCAEKPILPPDYWSANPKKTSGTNPRKTSHSFSWVARTAEASFSKYVDAGGWLSLDVYTSQNPHPFKRGSTGDDVLHQLKSILGQQANPARFELMFVLNNSKPLDLMNLILNHI